MPIVKGDNGHIVPFSFERSLTGAYVTAKVDDGTRVFTKPCEITNFSEGECEFKLLAADLLHSGFYTYQATAMFGNGDTFSTTIKILEVEKSIEASIVSRLIDGGRFTTTLFERTFDGGKFTDLTFSNTIDGGAF